MSRYENTIQSATVAALSTLLLSRKAFPPECFQVVPQDAIVTGYNQIIRGGGPALLGQRVNVRDVAFLRECENDSLKSLRSTIESEYFPMLTTGLVKKLCLCVSRSSTITASSLFEVHELAFSVTAESKFYIRITSTCQTERSIRLSNDTNGYESLKRFLSQLPELGGPTYNSLIACVDSNSQYAGVCEHPSFDVNTALQMLLKKPSTKSYNSATIVVDLDGNTGEAPSKQATEIVTTKATKPKTSIEMEPTPTAVQTLVVQPVAYMDQDLFLDSSAFEDQGNSGNGLFNDYFSSPLASPVSGA